MTPDISPWEDIDDYLGELSRSKLMVVLIGTRRVGSSIQTSAGEPALATFFELELAFAAALGRPIAIVSVDGIEPDPKLKYLIELVERTLSVTQVRVKKPEEVVPEVHRIVEEVANGKYDCERTTPWQYGAFLDNRWNAHRGETFWLSETWPQFADHPTPNRSVIADCLSDMDGAMSEGQRLARLWVGMRELMCAPYREDVGRGWLEQWHHLLKMWSTAGAWYGLHGHLELGYLAATNSLAEVNTAARTIEPRRRGDPEWDIPYGAQASAYYAMARRVNSQAHRLRGLTKAWWLINRMKYRDPIGESNGLAIKGSILLELRNPLGILAYRRVLHLRETANASPGSIGEAMTELGYAYVRLRQRRKGLDLLERGVASMKEAGYRSGFVVRALYKLADAYECSGMDVRAQDARGEALALAQSKTVGAAAQDYSNPQWSGKR